MTQHIEDGYELGVVIGTVFGDLSAAYDTINHLRHNQPQATTEQDIQNDIRYQVHRSHWEHALQ